MSMTGMNQATGSAALALWRQTGGVGFVAAAPGTGGDAPMAAASATAYISGCLGEDMAPSVSGRRG
ncbi:hypothetical protein PJ900_00855 (plasmid) [Tistrella mobilis]|uniref:hypothetical protein n=1 Tax=Tistrella mobilis TaxID=171437 RepID=UPI0009ED6D52|nr:hypothetical protein [Tistrella mobilis]